jgi:hypothetical protein
MTAFYHPRPLAPKAIAARERRERKDTLPQSLIPEHPQAEEKAAKLNTKSTKATKKLL